MEMTSNKKGKLTKAEKEQKAFLLRCTYSPYTTKEEMVYINKALEKLGVHSQATSN